MVDVTTLEVDFQWHSNLDWFESEYVFATFWSRISVVGELVSWRIRWFWYWYDLSFLVIRYMRCFRSRLWILFFFFVFSLILKTVGNWVVGLLIKNTVFLKLGFTSFFGSIICGNVIPDWNYSFQKTDFEMPVLMLLYWIPLVDQEHEFFHSYRFRHQQF